MRPFLAFVSLAILASGCFGKGGDGETPPATTGLTTQPPTATLGVSTPLPEWVVGQRWTYAVEIVGRPVTEFNMVVAEDRDTLWIVATDDRAEALNHALYSTNPVLGRIVKDRLSPYQSGGPVEMFQFPLTDRKTWSAKFFDEAMAFRTTYDDEILTVPGRGGNPPVFLPGFQVEATGPSGARVLFNYVEDVEWFSDFQYFDRNGTKQIHLSLESFGLGFTGPYHFLRGEDKLFDDRTASTGVGSPRTFEVTADDGLDGLGLGVIAIGAGQQSAIVNVTLKGPDGATRYSRQITDLSPGRIDLDQREIPSTNGVWNLEVLIVGSARVETRVAGLLITSGTL